MKALPEESFNIPWIVIGGSGPQPDLTKEQALARFEGSLKELLASGWGKSVFTTEKSGAERQRGNRQRLQYALQDRWQRDVGWRRLLPVRQDQGRVADGAVHRARTRQGGAV